MDRGEELTFTQNATVCLVMDDRKARRPEGPALDRQGIHFGAEVRDYSTELFSR